MAAGAWEMPNATRTKLLDGTIDVDTDVWKIALFLSTSNLDNTKALYTDLTNEVATAFGYTQDDETIVLALTGTTTVKVDINVDPVWTAAGGSITARWAVIYKDAGNQDTLVWCLLDSTPADVTATDGNTLTVAAHASGVFTLA